MVKKKLRFFFFFSPLSLLSLSSNNQYGNCVLLQQHRQKILLKEESKGKAKMGSRRGGGGGGGHKGWAETSYGAQNWDPIDWGSQLILSYISCKSGGVGWGGGVTVRLAQRNPRDAYGYISAFLAVIIISKAAQAAGVMKSKLSKGSDRRNRTLLLLFNGSRQ